MSNEKNELDFCCEKKKTFADKFNCNKIVCAKKEKKIG